MSDSVKRFPPTRPGNYSATRFNARKHGLLSSPVLLPFEDPKAHRTLLDDLFTEHQPHGRIEVHLVEDLAGVMLRIHRVQMAERGIFVCALERAIAANTPGFDDEAKAALLRIACATDEQVAIDQAELAKTRQSIADAVPLLDPGLPDSYHRALEIVTPEIRSAWLQDRASPPSCLADRAAQFSGDVLRLRSFLTLKLQRKLCDRQDALDNRSRIRDAAFGDPDYISALQLIARYEAHLDRKAERLLTMLFRLQELRGARTLIDPIKLPD